MVECSYIQKVGAYHDGELTADQRADMEQHLATGCTQCAAELRQLTKVSTELRSLLAPPAMHPEMLDRLHDHVDSLQERSVLHFAEALSGIAAALFIAASLWAMRTPAASAEPLAGLEQAAAALQPQLAENPQQPGSLHAAEWIVNDLAGGVRHDE